MYIREEYGRKVIMFESKREEEVFQMIVKDANLQEVRDDVKMEAYQLWQEITEGL